MTTSSRTLRLFVSSTFDDFTAERDALQRGVYSVTGELLVESPFRRLRQRCITHESDLEIVDLRWGISAAVSTSYATMHRCLAEVRLRSPRPIPTSSPLSETGTDGSLGDGFHWWSQLIMRTVMLTPPCKPVRSELLTQGDLVHVGQNRDHAPGSQQEHVRSQHRHQSDATNKTILEDHDRAARWRDATRRDGGRNLL